MYENSEYGRDTFADFHSRYVAAGHCLTAAIPFDMDNMDDAYVDSLLTNALSTGTTGVVFLGHNNFARALVKRAEARLPGMSIGFIELTHLEY